MGKRTIIAFLCAGWMFGACTVEQQPQPTANSAVYPQLQAEIAGAKSVDSRTEVNPVSGTYVRFTQGDQLGLFATKALRVHVPEVEDADLLALVANLKFTLSSTGRWIGGDPNVPLLRWDNAPPAASADIYAYFPYQENGIEENEDGFLDGYELFASTSDGGSTGVLKDVLIAERTTVENNNPAIFLTFKHRFALLHLEMGTGMGAITANDEITAVMSQGVSDKALLEPQHGIVIPVAGDVENFAPVKKGNDYYILIPTDVFDGVEIQPLRLVSICIRTSDGETEFSDLATELYPESNTVYNMTLHKGEEGSIAVEMGYIELWEDWNDLAGIRQTGGLYWASDLVGLANAVKSGGYGESNTALSKYGEWDAVNQCWVFKLMRNIDMSDVSNGKNAMFETFKGVFDGCGYAITGLDVDVSADANAYAGLFGTVLSGSVIKDLTLVSPSIVGSSNAGALAGYVASGVTIRNCHVEGYSLVSGNGAVGGLVGACESNLTRCSANDISVVNGFGDGAGGLVGILTGTISDSRASGSVVSQGGIVGGLVGQADGTVTGCSANCDVSGTSDVGGLIGKASEPVENCNSAGVIVATQDNAGGLIGQTSSSVKSCTSDGSVSGTDNVGGLIGLHAVPDGTAVVVEGCSSRASVTGSGETGGLIGKAAEYIEVKVEIPDPEGGESTWEVSDRKGTIIEYCYVLNGLPMTGSGGLATYGYEIGTTYSENTENHYYTIVPGTSNIPQLLDDLNSGAKKVWKASTVVIDGKGYSIPILTTYN